MADDRIIVAIERIERGLARLERLATRPPRPAPDPAPNPAIESAYARLVERHERLRAETGSAVAALDRLIAAMDPDQRHG